MRPNPVPWSPQCTAAQNRGEEGAQGHPVSAAVISEAVGARPGQGRWAQPKGHTRQAQGGRVKTKAGAGGCVWGARIARGGGLACKSLPWGLPRERGREPLGPARLSPVSDAPTRRFGGAAPGQHVCLWSTGVCRTQDMAAVQTRPLGWHRPPATQDERTPESPHGGSLPRVGPWDPRHGQPRKGLRAPHLALGCPSGRH